MSISFLRLVVALLVLPAASCTTTAGKDPEIPFHGEFCGPNYPVSGESLSEKAQIEQLDTIFQTRRERIDDIDIGCYQHDKCYVRAKTNRDRITCDEEIVDYLEKTYFDRNPCNNLKSTLINIFNQKILFDLARENPLTSAPILATRSLVLLPTMAFNNSAMAFAEVWDRASPVPDFRFCRAVN